MALTNFPVPKFIFTVEIEDFVSDPESLDFKEVTGLPQEYETLEYREGNYPAAYTSHRLGLVKSSPVTLKKGIFRGGKELINVIQEPLDQFDNYWADGTPKNITITLKNEKNEPVVIWKLKSCIPTKITFSDLNSTESEVAIEEMELKYEFMEFEYR